VTIEASLPPELRGATITRIAAGLSGTGVYRVEAAGQAYVLKVSSESLEDWQRKVAILEGAAAAGVAPRVVHVDAERRAVLSELVVDRSFFAFYASAKEAALAALGRTIQRVHAIPPPPGAARDARPLLRTMAAHLDGFARPGFVDEAVQRVLDEVPPTCDRVVLSHNDINPTNLIYDGARIVLLDWDTAGPNDPYYDLAAPAVFFRMDDAACSALLAAYDGTRELPDRFRYDRRLVAAMCGAVFLFLARQQGHTGDRDAPRTALADVYQGFRAGTISAASADGQWQFGLALVTSSLTL
jgi:aminoglycoside phosphotransferase (APT) family kinase protein